jgi:hypothetical protein
MRAVRMNRNSQLINERYEAMMFAKSPEGARRAARELVRFVLGDAIAERSLEDGLREVCRRIRPSDDPREQSRFETEFVELGIWADGSQKMAA